MNVAILYESLTGNTRKCATLISKEFASRGVTASVSPVDQPDYASLAVADLVIVGTWVDGLLVVGQRPGRAGKLRKFPAIDRKQCIVFCTYAVNPGPTLKKLTRLMEGRGAEVLGGLAIHRSNLPDGAADLVDQALRIVRA